MEIVDLLQMATKVLLLVTIVVNTVVLVKAMLDNAGLVIVLLLAGEVILIGVYSVVFGFGNAVKMPQYERGD